MILRIDTPVSDHLKSLSPSAIDFEFRSISAENHFHEHKLVHSLTFLYAAAVKIFNLLIPNSACTNDAEHRTRNLFPFSYCLTRANAKIAAW